MDKELSKKYPIVRYSIDEFLEVEDEIVSEFPITIQVNGEEFATIVCSPMQLDEMVYGFLASEGVIRSLADVRKLTLDQSKGFAYIELSHPLKKDPQFYSKRFIGSCCGKSRQFYLQNDVRTAKTSTTKMTITPKQCIRLMNLMQEKSSLFQNTGGVHNAALCHQKELIVMRSDIGRHNALDKLFGYCLIHKIPARNKILVFSGRISSEVLTKAAKIGVGIVLSKSAPTDLALKLANDLNITAIGFIRGNSFNIYTHPHRVVKE